MNILAIITGLIKLAGIVAQLAQERQLISAGEAKAVVQSVRATLENLELARRGRDAMESNAAADVDWAQRVRDKYTRDE